MLWCAAWFRQSLLFSREEKMKKIQGKLIISANSPACLQLIAYIVALAVYKGSLWFKDLFILDGSCVENSRSYPKSCMAGPAFDVQLFSEEVLLFSVVTVAHSGENSCCCWTVLLLMPPPCRSWVLVPSINFSSCKIGGGMPFPCIEFYWRQTSVGPRFLVAVAKMGCSPRPHVC